MPFNFPSAPAVNDPYSYGAQSWRYNGTGWVKVTRPSAYDYAARASLRTLTPLARDLAVVQGLGLFIWVAGSDLLDDDETVFSTVAGDWILVAADPDYVHAVVEALQDDLDDLQLVSNSAALAAAAAQSTADTLAGKFLRGTFPMSLTSLAAITSSAFTATVAGAAVGDSVIVNPGNAFGTSAGDQAKLSFAALVSAVDTVTVTIRNSSASTASMTASTWAVLVIKQ